jgi:hypothetical protein
MNRHILHLAALILLLSSCTALYKTGQTPDDVYYSPAEGLIIPAIADADKDNNTETAVQSPLTIFSPIDPYPNQYCGYAPYYGGYIYTNYCSYNQYYGGYVYSPYSYNDPYNYTYGHGYDPYVYHPIYVQPYVNHTPRKVNLNAYKSGYNNGSTLVQPAATSAKMGTVAPAKSSFGQTLQHFFSSGNNNSNSSGDNNSSSDNNSNNSNNTNNGNYNNSTSRPYTPNANNGAGNSGAGLTRPSRVGR